MIPTDLLSILCCPETHQALRMAEATIIAQLNQKIAAGGVRNRAGQLVTEQLQTGLIRSDDQFLYPVRGNLPVLLVDEAIPLKT